MSGHKNNAAYIATAASQIITRTPLQRSNTLVHEATRRHASDVPEPAWHKPTEREFFAQLPDGRKVPNPAFLKQHFFREGRLTEDQAQYILKEGTRFLKEEPNLLRVEGPITVCGDLHGQYYDLMKLFDIGGDPAQNTYLFLGDYVDRGCFGIECLLYLYALKICYPKRIYLLRGNHECRHLTEYFTFQRECVRKYSMTIYNESCDSFCALPLAAVLDGRFFCVHGGLSPELNYVEDINKVNRFQEPPSHGLLCDLLWSDPHPNFGHEDEAGQNNPVSPGGAGGSSFLHNQARGCSYLFTYTAACNFLDRNNLLGVIRGHEAQQAGYQMYRKTPKKKFPSVITIFSAPNYCDVYRNRAAVLKYVNKNITIRQFNASVHPYWLPNFMDAFTWSLPFVGDKIVQMLLAILSICTAEELEESSEDEETKKDEEEQRRQEMRNKILAVGRMRKVFQLLREESEAASELSSAMASSGMAVHGPIAAQSDELSVQMNRIRRSIRNFDDARRHDIYNERLPTFPTHSSRPASPENEPRVAMPEPGFPLVQAPSTRSWRMQEDFDIETYLRQLRQGGEGYEDEVAREIAERYGRHGHHNHPQQHQVPPPQHSPQVVLGSINGSAKGSIKGSAKGSQTRSPLMGQHDQIQEGHDQIRSQHEHLQEEQERLQEEMRMHEERMVREQLEREAEAERIRLEEEDRRRQEEAAAAIAAADEKEDDEPQQQGGKKGKGGKGKKGRGKKK